MAFNNDKLVEFEVDAQGEVTAIDSDGSRLTLQTKYQMYRPGGGDRFELYNVADKYNRSPVFIFNEAQIIAPVHTDADDLESQLRLLKPFFFDGAAALGLTQDIIDALISASPAPSGSNPFVTNGDSRLFKEIYDNYNDLIANETPGTDIGSIYWVRNPQGTNTPSFLPGWVGGDYYPSGAYLDTGSSFESGVEDIIEALAKINNTSNVWEAYEVGSTAIGSTPTIINFNTDRESSPFFVLSGGRVIIQAILRELILTYSVTPDRQENNRANALHEVYFDNGGGPNPYVGSRSFSYHRTLNTGEDTGTKTVTFNNLLPGDIIDVRSSIFSGGSGTDLLTVSGGSNLILNVRVI